MAEEKQQGPEPTEDAGAPKHDALNPEPEVVIEEPVMTDVAQFDRSELDLQIQTAKRYPRSIARFAEDVTTLATMNQETATGCLYALPRGGKSIEGPSVRLAEIVASCWGNSRYGARVVAVREDDGVVIAQGTFLDLERNVGVTFEVRRRIVDKDDRLYSADMIAQTGNAACAIALRNSVFRGVPKVFWGPAYTAARKTALGQAKNIATRRAEMLEAFLQYGVVEEQILRAIDKPEMEQVTDKDLLVLRGTFTAIREDEVQIDEAFPPLPSAPTQPKRKSEAPAKNGNGGPKRKGDAKQGEPAQGENPAEREPGEDG